MRSNVWRLLAPATGPLAVLLTVLGIFVWHPGIAQAAPALSFDGSCTPDTVRPAAAALITCTVSVTNTGDAPALNLAAQPSAPTLPCAIASPIYIDRTINGVSVPASGTRYNLGNLAPNAKVTSITRLAIINQGSGLKGTKVTVFSQAVPAIQASGDVCWNVDPSATDPSLRMAVTKTPINTGGCFTPPISSPATLESKSHRAFEERRAKLLGQPLGEPEPQGFFGCPPPPRPDYGGPVPVSPPDPTPGLVEFEIVVTNLSGPAVLDISVLDVETGSGVFVQSEPPPTGADFLGRPVWNVGTLNQGEEYRIVASYGPQQADRCLMAYDVAAVTSTPTGGSAENYAAFPGTGQQVGNCEGGGTSTLCWHYPPDSTGYPYTEQCDEEVCWVQYDFGGGEVFWDRHFGDCTEEVCRFLPPEGGDTGFNPIEPCDPPLCWMPHGEVDWFHYDPTGCGTVSCEYTAPDGTTTYFDECDFPVCWTMPPGASAWEARFFEQCQIANPCWFMPPGKGEPALDSCDQDITEVCWSTDFFGGGFEEGAPVPAGRFSGPIAQSGGDSYFTVPCNFVFCEYTAPDGTTAIRTACDQQICWSMPPEGGDWQHTFSCTPGIWCWYTPAGGGASILEPCGEQLCFISAPAGALDAMLYFGEFYFYEPPPFPIGCGFAEELCWSMPPAEKGAFVAALSYCDENASICWGAPPNDTADWPVECGTSFCWSSWPADFPDPVDRGLSPDQVVAVPCPPGETGETGQTGSSAVAEGEPALSAPADLVESQSVQQLVPEPSQSKTPATFEPGTSASVDALPSSDSIPVEIYRPDIVDYDGDGCNNLHERSFDPLAGGLRDPDNVWDFFDTPGAGNARDGSITVADVARIVQRFGRSGSASIDPLSMPPAPPLYHTAFDRTPAGAGPDGAITVQDIAVGVGQFGNTCL